MGSSSDAESRLSRELRAEVGDLTDEAFALLSDKVTEHVTVLRGYLELTMSGPTKPEYIANLRRSLSALADVVEANGQERLTSRLDSVIRRLQ